VGDGTTVLLASQYLEEADRLADRLVVIDHGRVIASGTPADLKSSLATPVLEITLPDEASAARGAELLGSGPTPVGLDAATLRLQVAEPAHEVVRLLRTLDDAGLPLVALSLHEPSLHDAFIALTEAAGSGGDDNGDTAVTEREPEVGVA
jgi:ABC-2 type transport system ATP-binding protein